jgi:hypothetical protein
MNAMQVWAARKPTFLERGLKQCVPDGNDSRVMIVIKPALPKGV